MPNNALVFPGSGTPQVPEVGIAIAPTRNGAHVGLCYRDDDGTQWLMHLASHCRLRKEPFAEALLRYAIGPSTMPPPRAQAVSVFLGYIWEKCGSGGITYGLKYKGPTFGPDGSLHLPDGAIGLTCATFVISALGSIEVQLLAYETWPARDSDAAAQAAIIRDIEEYGADLRRLAEAYRSQSPGNRGSDEAVEAILRQVEERAAHWRERGQALRGEMEDRAVRFRPEEVAVGMLTDYHSWPLPFPDVEESARNLMAEVVRGCRAG